LLPPVSIAHTLHTQGTGVVLIGTHWRMHPLGLLNTNLSQRQHCFLLSFGSILLLISTFENLHSGIKER
jgi:hypothetical protein